MLFIVPVFTDVFGTIGIGIGALAMECAITEFTDVFATIGIGIGALAMGCAIPEFTDIFGVTTGMGIGAKDVFAAIGIGIGAKAVLINFVLIFRTGKEIGSLCRIVEQ